MCRIDLPIAQEWLQAEEYDQVVFALGKINGGDRSNCDSFYHWGALLAYIYLLDEGFSDHSD